MSKNNFIFFSPAKLNLFLEVLNKEHNGFHNLNSLMCFCDIGDYIKLEKSSSLSLEIEGPFARNLKKFNKNENLIIKSIKVLKKAIDFDSNFNIKLVKNLPISSGLGGGSSNAATVVRAICKIQSLNIPNKRLMDLLFSLGSDIPFCFLGKTALVQGVGEKVEPTNIIPIFNVLLVNPLIEVSTKEIFKKINNFSKKKTKLPNYKMEINELIKFLSFTKNDLQDIASDLQSEIKLILNIFKSDKNVLLYRMSGSGGTCFGIYKNKTTLESAVQFFQKYNKNWWVRSGKILNHI